MHFFACDLILMLQRVSQRATKAVGVLRENQKQRSNRTAAHPEEQFDNRFLIRSVLVTEAGSAAILWGRKRYRLNLSSYLRETFPGSVGY